MRDVVIIGAARTPIGSFGGALAKVTAPKLGAVAIKGAVERAGVNPADINEVIMGCVLTAGVGQAPARQAAIFADLPQSVPCMTINKVCGSGLKAVMLAAQAIKAGEAEVVRTYWTSPVRTLDTDLLWIRRQCPWVDPRGFHLQGFCH